VFEITHFAVNPIKGELPRSALLFDGKDTGIVVDGLMLEKQIQLSAGYLLLLTENCPYEEGLHIYLLDQDLRVLDGIELSQPYAPALLSGFTCDAENSFSFSFFGEERWRLALLKSPARMLNIAVFSAVKHKGGWFPVCWLSLERVS